MGMSSGVPNALVYDPNRLGLLTDLYELTMSAAYWTAGLADCQATFDLFFRGLPPNRNFLVAAGLEQAVHYLLNLRFTDRDIDYLRSLPLFARVPSEWFAVLRELRFHGDLWAIPEGTVVFAQEPVLRVTAPVMVAQIAETYLLTCLSYESSVATKAARLAIASGDRSVVDFGSRRAHGPQAGLLAARASFIGGCRSTSNVFAAEQLGIPPVGTMAHSWIMAFEDEREAFHRFDEVFPNQSTFLIDTYDTEQGAWEAVRGGAKPAALRLDSGDLASLSRQVRKILDSAGWHDVQLFASGDLNEYKIDALLKAGSPIDAFGVGTELATVADAPSLSAVYKLVDFEGLREHSGRIKLSPGKRTYPGRKQVFRTADSQGQFQGDVIGLADENLSGTALLQAVIERGKLAAPLPSLRDSQSRCHDQLQRLPSHLASLTEQADYPVTVSQGLQAEFDRMARMQSHRASSE